MEGDLESLIWVGLGANLGDAANSLRAALAGLRRWPGLVPGSFMASSFYHSKPVDCPPGSPDYLNAVCCFRLEGELEAEGFLRQALDFEAVLGRRRSGILNESRILDLDLLAFRRVVCRTSRLVLPHPRAHLRGFVLAPMAEICPTYCFPGFDLSVSELLQGLKGGQEVWRAEKAEKAEKAE